MLSPLSYFGLSTNHGFLRITCSGNDGELCDLMDRLESRLYETRKSTYSTLFENVTQELMEIGKIDPHLYETMSHQIPYSEQDNCLSLKTKNLVLREIQYTLSGFLHLIKK